LIIFIIDRHYQQTVIEEGVAIAARISSSERRVGVLRADVEKRARVCILHHVSQLKRGHVRVGRDKGDEIEDLAVANRELEVG
jgi:hypothetical protein